MKFFYAATALLAFWNIEAMHLKGEDPRIVQFVRGMFEECDLNRNDIAEVSEF